MKRRDAYVWRLLLDADATLGRAHEAASRNPTNANRAAVVRARERAEACRRLYHDGGDMRSVTLPIETDEQVLARSEARP